MNAEQMRLSDNWVTSSDDVIKSIKCHLQRLKKKLPG